MILIQERKNKKMPGMSSLFVSFQYNPTIIEIIKQTQMFNYDKDTKEWEVPVTSLSELLVKLTDVDEIKLEFLDTKEKKDKTFKLSDYQTKPFDYQLDGIQYGLNHDKWLLLDAPGLGKTLQLTYLAKELKERKNIEHCLIICGINTLKTNWKKEIKKHSDLSAMILGERVNTKGNTVYEGVSYRVDQLNKPIDEFFVITNVESLRDDRVVKAINKGPNKFDMIVFDEIHTCCSYDTIIQTNLGNLKIGDIVTNEIQCEVLSYNGTESSYKPIINYNKFNNVTELVELTVEDEYGKEFTVKVTPDHLIYTHNRGYIEAYKLTNDDILEINY